MPNLTLQPTSAYTCVCVDPSKYSSPPPLPDRSTSNVSKTATTSPTQVKQVNIDELYSASSSSSSTSTTTNREQQTGNSATTSTQESVQSTITKTNTSITDGTTYGKVLYVETEGPSASIYSGVSLGSVEVGAVKIGSDSENVRWNLSIASASAQAGVEYSLNASTGYYTKSSSVENSVSGLDYVGFAADASLLEAGVSVDFPLPFTDKELTVTLTGKAFSIGAEANYDSKTNTVTVGASALIGGSISVGVN